MDALTSKKETQSHCTKMFMRKFSRSRTISVCFRRTITSELHQVMLVYQKSRERVHLCRGQTETSVAEEKEFNPRLSQTLEDFVETMENLNLPYPKQIGEFKIEVQPRTTFYHSLIALNRFQSLSTRQTPFSFSCCRSINFQSSSFNFMSLKNNSGVILNFDYFSFSLWVSVRDFLL